MVDVSQHELVPDHTVLDSDELEDVLAEYDIKKTDLPKIKRTDPALPDEAEVGDVIKVERDSRTTDRAVVYRLVIE
ncbi:MULTISPECIES: DNA-directed RNA polymerase subunit H [Halapricum]|uniref:DNA-directed RNA polymerase subunit Rpo5 n=2 Tax=Halapricum TaxID=1542963 RepID=A0A897NKT3_9EURY|nr:MULTISPECIES: DNA-directed RNA polymerase subunit H [Halapricum]MCU4717649.1 DNA-directed RNA polymerase subunit H [Halapricum hydrolyticum]MCU4726822.1 DNA-directed RNA polymerase subunit H [Halapricum hydrolyticum]QSG07830.1 DNA-directed RNA polymerase, subunit H, RpoH/RPB5 [Halapricum desulfuricans]QSG13044.1 DNA-directed RNA polymerase, subunit H, RpoH/RPB5 [Halapricum desulfuricans]